MITGVGTDIIEVNRIDRALKRRKSFISRVFTAAEQEYCSSGGDRSQRFAGRFAAKEAVAKSLGTSLSWLDVEILADERGKPIVKLLNGAAVAGDGCRVMVSISHCREYAVAYAVACVDS